MEIEDNGASPLDAEDTAAVLAYEQGAPAPEDTPGADAAAETDAQPAPEPKRQSAQDRIDEVTRARREAEREAAHWKRIATEGRQPEPQPQPAADGEPDPSKYAYGQSDPEFIRDYTAHVTRQTIRQEMDRQNRDTQAQALAKTWDDRQQAFAKDHPDFFEKITAEDLTITPVMADAIKTSEEGARVAYHLAENPDEARRIAALNPLAQVRELGRLEAKLATPPAEPVTPPKTVSDAPAPAPQARGLKGQFKPPADTSDFAAFERAYGNG